MKLKVANAYSDGSGKHQVLWLAGGYAVVLHEEKQEIFDTLDEAIAKVRVPLTHDPDLLRAWLGGYELPADEDQNWPEIFLVKDEK